MTTPRLPLAEIRAAEMAAAQAVAAATERSAKAIAAARREANQIVEEGRDRGRVLGDERYVMAVADAEIRAAEIADSLEAQARNLRTRIEPELDRLVSMLMNLILPRTE